MNITNSWQLLFQDIKDEYGRQNLDEVETLRTANRVLSELVDALDLPTTTRIARIAYIFDAEKYQIPTDMKMNGIIELRYDNQFDNINTRPFIILCLLSK